MSSNNIFKENSKSSRSSVKAAFENEVEYKCVLCDNQGYHNGKELILQLDHINGIRNDNRFENLRLLCPNCHTQQITSNRNSGYPKFQGSKKIVESEVIELACNNTSIRSILLSLNASDSGSNYDIVKKILEKNNITLKNNLIIKSKNRKGDNFWRHQPRPKTEKIEWPSDQDLSKMVFEKPLIQLSKELRVSDVAIKQRCKRRRIETPPQGFWTRVKNGYSKEEALNGVSKKRNKQEKLKDSEVLAIRHLIKDGLSLRKIGEMFNRSHATISDIKRNKSYKYIES